MGLAVSWAGISLRVGIAENCTAWKEFAEFVTSTGWCGEGACGSCGVSPLGVTFVVRDERRAEFSELLTSPGGWEGLLAVRCLAAWVT